MILKANERGGAKQLAGYLLRNENEHAELIELRGFSSDTLHGAFEETEAISRATKCENYFFSLSLNPPDKANVSDREFAAAADQIEKRLGLEGQPRALVRHENNGRPHVHAVWSRIDAEKMQAIPCPFSR